MIIMHDCYQNLNNSAASDDGETCADAEANLKIMITLWKWDGGCIYGIEHEVCKYKREWQKIELLNILASGQLQ